MAKKLIKEKQVLFCRDCKEHFGEHNEAVTAAGEAKRFILCKCKLDEIDHLLNYDYCKNLKININERN